MLIVPINTTIASDEEPLFITQYDSHHNCSLTRDGDVATTFKLIPTSICSPILISGRITMFYVFIPGRTKLRFKCLDQSCRDCVHEIDIVKDGTCHNLESGSFSTSTNQDIDIKDFSKFGNGTRLLTLYYLKSELCLQGIIFWIYFKRISRVPIIFLILIPILR